MTDIEKIEIEKMAQKLNRVFCEKFNYVPPCGYKNATLYGLPFIKIAQCLIELGYRQESEVKTETAKGILAQVQSILDGMVKSDYEDSVQYYQGDCEKIDDQLYAIAVQYGVEE